MFRVFEGVYPDFAATGCTLELFDSSDYLRAMEVKLERQIAERAAVTDYVLAPILATLLASKGSLSVLDFGGGAAMSFPSVKDAIGGSGGLTFHVLDGEGMCDVGRKHLGAETGLEFFSAAAALRDHYDFAHFGSVLQYIEDIDGVLALVCAKQPGHILVSDAMVAGKTFTTVADYYGYKHPHKFIEMKEFIGYFEKRGYRLGMKVPFVPIIQGQRGFYDMSNLPEDCRVDHTYHLLFVKAD